MRRAGLAVSLVLLFLSVGCKGMPKVAQTAVYTAAAAQGFIAQAQVNHAVACTANPKQDLCVTINRAVAAQNALVDALEAYCSFPARPTPQQLAALGQQKCVPVPNAEAALAQATVNLAALLPDLRKAADATATGGTK